MINLDPGCDCDVALQFKHPSYYMAHGHGHYMLVPQNHQQEHSPPALVDWIEGRLHKEGDQYLLKYSNPAEPSVHIDMVVDPEEIARMWIVRRVVISSIIAP